MHMDLTVALPSQHVAAVCSSQISPVLGSVLKGQLALTGFFANQSPNVDADVLQPGGAKVRIAKLKCACAHWVLCVGASSVGLCLCLCLSSCVGVCVNVLSGHRFLFIVVCVCVCGEMCMCVGGCLQVYVSVCVYVGLM